MSDRPRRPPLIELLVVVLLAVPLTLLLLVAARDQTRRQAERVELSVNSDPSGARVYVDRVLHGRTPLTVTLARGTRAQLRLEADPSGDGLRFSPWEGVVDLDDDRNLDVWLERSAP